MQMQMGVFSRVKTRFDRNRLGELLVAKKPYQPYPASGRLERPKIRSRESQAFGTIFVR